MNGACDPLLHRIGTERHMQDCMVWERALKNLRVHPVYLQPRYCLYIRAKSVPKDPDTR